MLMDKFCYKQYDNADNKKAALGPIRSPVGQTDGVNNYENFAP